MNDKKGVLTCIKEDATFTKQQKEDQKNVFMRRLRTIKSDILSFDAFKSSAEDHSFIIQAKQIAIPNKSTFEKDSIFYDLQCSPQDYIPCMLKMMQELERQGIKLLSVFPLRTDVIPKHVKFDTTTITHMLMSKALLGRPKSFYLRKGNLVKHEDDIWKAFFRTEKKVFHNCDTSRYRFNYMIETDGVGCSIQVIRQDKAGRKFVRAPKNVTREPYFDEVDYNQVKDKKLVSIDPNMSDLLFCMSAEDGKLRYTQDQRRKETKQKKYAKIQEGMKENSDVKQLETELSQYNKKTLVFDDFKQYIMAKNRINAKLFQFYEQGLFRKLKLNGYINRMRSEQRFMKRFEDKYGKPDEVVIGIGDWEQYQHRKFKEPVKGKGFREMLRKYGYEVYLVDEHKTSCTCHGCKAGRCETFRECKNPRPWKRDDTIKRHGLLMCQTCKRLWCRDTNSSLNILEVMMWHINGMGRPDHLKRTRQQCISDATSVSQNQNLHEDAKPQL
jgi:hypothetical protein